MSEIDFESLLENDHSYLRLLQDIDRGRVLHAILLTGTDKSYLEAFSKAVVSHILEKGGQNELAQKVLRGTFLDLVVLENEKSIKTQDINQIVQKASEHGIECDQKFYIILDAEKMTEEAQNKLLKTLEEPSSDQYFILCAPSRFLLLPTIVSRCNTIDLVPASKEVLSCFVQKHTHVSERIAKEAVENSLGNASKAIETVGKANENFELALSALVGISTSSDCLLYATKFQKSNFIEVLNYMEFILLDAIKLSFGIENIWFETKLEKIKSLSTSKSKALLFVYETIGKLKKLVAVNVSTAYLADKLALAIAEGKHL